MRHVLRPAKYRTVATGLGSGTGSHVKLPVRRELRSEKPTMEPNDDFLSAPQFDYEGWRNALSHDWGWYSPKFIEPEAFAGRARPRSVCGLVAMDISGNASCVERTARDARVDGIEHHYAVFQVGGRSTVIQDDCSVKLEAGDVALVDSARPVTYALENRYGRYFSLQLPRQSLVSHLGFEPRYASFGGCERRAGQLLFQLVRDMMADEKAAATAADAYMRLAVYDLLGALFAPADLTSVSLHSDKLFARLCSIIRARFADPDISPYEVATEAGISLRYLQKLFTARGMTCGHFIHSLRLDHAAQLLRRRALTQTRQPLCEIAYACGFRDYTYFARAFRRQFGRPPGAAGRQGHDIGNTDADSHPHEIAR